MIIAEIVWLIAGFNVARIGVLSYLEINRKWYLYLLSAVVFLPVWLNVSENNMEYESHHPFWHFFDLKAYLIMACMMGSGIDFRALGIFPDIFVAFFYFGLGCALALAGILFIKNYFCYSKLINKEKE